MVSSSSLAPVAAATAAAVWVYLWVSTPQTTSTRSARLGIAFTPLVRMGTCMVPVRLEDGTTVMGHDPADTGDGHAPDQASNSGRAGAGRRMRTSPREGTRASQIMGHAPVCRPQPTAPRAAGTTLTVRSGVVNVRRARRGLSNGRRQNLHHRKTSTPTPAATRRHPDQTHQPATTPSFAKSRQSFAIWATPHTCLLYT